MDKDIRKVLREINEINIKTKMFEVLDNPYNWKIEKEKPYYIEFRFETKGGYNYVVNIEYVPSTPMDYNSIINGIVINFYLISGSSMRVQGVEGVDTPFRVFSTVVDIVKSFIKGDYVENLMKSYFDYKVMFDLDFDSGEFFWDNKVDGILFVANFEEKSRVKIYERFARMMCDEFGFSIKYDEYMVNGVRFILVSDYMNYEKIEDDGEERIIKVLKGKRY